VIGLFAFFTIPFAQWDVSVDLNRRRRMAIEAKEYLLLLTTSKHCYPPPFVVVNLLRGRTFSPWHQQKEVTDPGVPDSSRLCCIRFIFAENCPGTLVSVSPCSTCRREPVYAFVFDIRKPTNGWVPYTLTMGIQRISKYFRNRSF